MAVVKEWTCLEHGEFDSTHPICPNFRCESKFVKQEFRTPVSIGTQFKKRFDAGIRKSADMMHISNFRTAREGEAAYGGDKAKELGMEVLWGDESKKKMGKSFAELTGIAQKPLIVQKRDGGELRLDRNNAMREAANEAGITRRAVPKAHEVTVVAKEHKRAPNVVQSLTA